MDLDLVISLHRSRSASPSFHSPAPPLPLLDLKPGSAGRSGLRALSFAGASKNAALYGGRRSSFARSSDSARSLLLFMESPASAGDEDDAEPEPRWAPSRDVIRQYLTKISMRLRQSMLPRRGGEGVGLRRLRKTPRRGRDRRGRASPCLPCPQPWPSGPARPVRWLPRAPGRGRRPRLHRRPLRWPPAPRTRCASPARRGPCLRACRGTRRHPARAPVASASVFLRASGRSWRRPAGSLHRRPAA
jgi:hypothetical protein